MNTKTLLLAILIFLNFQIVSAQNTIDTTITIHARTSFPGDDQASRLMVINDVFDALTHKWSVTVDMYGRISTDNCKDDLNKMRSSIHFSNLYKKQIVNGTWDVIWVKGDSVKNGYWIQYDFDSDDGISKVCEGFVVNGLRENKWIEYDDGIKIGEGNYLHGKREGVWKSRQQGRSDKDYYYESTGTYRDGLKQGEWLEYVCSVETGKKSPVGRKILYRNDTLCGNYKEGTVLKENKDPDVCHPCNLLKENLIYIQIRSRSNKAKDINELLVLFDSLHLDLYSDKVLRTYTDEGGETKMLTVREHNQNVFAGTWWFQKHGFDGPVVVNKNTLIVEKKHGTLNGINDEVLKKLRESGLFIGRNVMPLCTYTLSPDYLLSTITADNLSADDEAVIMKKMKISPIKSTSSYNIENLSTKEIEKLLKLLCESNSVTDVYCVNSGYMIHH